MSAPALTAGELADLILARPASGRRRLVALAGAPASGKSTLADALADRLRSSGTTPVVVPMDGFHLHNPILSDCGLLDRKGAPDTFDVRGLLALVARLRDEDEVFFPLFDRSRDIAIAGAGRVGSNCDTVIVEGNYLLYDAPMWRELRSYWDVAIRLSVPLEVLKDRLKDRWLTHGLSLEQALKKVDENDLKNARLVEHAPLPADITL